MDPALHRTKFAAQAATLADQFKNAVRGAPVGGHLGEMTTPEASTGGGVQSLQHIRLVPRAGGGRTYVIGNANRVGAVAELRSLEYVDHVSLERFGERTGFDPQAYAAFLAVATQFLEQFGLTVTLATAPVGGFSTRATSPHKGGLSGIAIFALVIWSLALVAVGAVLGVVAMSRGWIH